MKNFFTFFLLILSTGNCFSQNSGINIFYLNNLPTEGVLLDKGWKFYAGDDFEFVNPNYDDSRWQSINPGLNIHDQPAIAKTGICWLRLHLSIDSSVQKEQLAMMVSQAVASEIYLNGRLIYQFGKISSNRKDIKAYDPFSKPLSFPIDKNQEQVLAVRYAVEPNVLYTNIWRQNPIISITINKMNISAAQWEWRRAQRGLPSVLSFNLGAFLILAILFIAFFCYYPDQKANLFFFLYALCQMADDIFSLNRPHEIRYFFYCVNLSFLFGGVAPFLLLTALYIFFKQKKGWIYWSLLVAVITGVILNGFGRADIQTNYISNLVNIEIVRIAFKALKLKNKGAWIMTVGAMGFLIFWGAFVLSVNYNFMTVPISENYILGDIFFHVGKLSIPVSACIYLALEFAFTSNRLRQKLTEVEDLSQKTIAQEKEKQQILFSVNDTLEKQVTERTAELNKSLEELKTTQKQLIQSEKMASLGELTAGIAHEIQNPLNFVNNFSEVNDELLKELNAEAEKGNLEEVKAIAKDIQFNSEKINHHGKRADGIVKGMLQHSRSSAGQKELTDINALCDEYLRLAYHGLRAKDKSFNATTKTDFDNSMGKINVVSQEIGRVILNLINNAFYAVSEKQKQNLNGYEPTVTVTTQKDKGKIEIKVKDNGNGIPQKVLDKIFQPFFTTKPTGQGTGLGLSLAYDIITKGHGGELKEETKEGEGSSFIITLPNN